MSDLCAILFKKNANERKALDMESDPMQQLKLKKKRMYLSHGV